MTSLLDEKLLEQSSVVANAAMNRERGITGINSYAKDLSFNPLDFLADRLRTQETVSWLDLCCGTGKALVQAAQHFGSAGQNNRITITGVDLVPMFAVVPAELKNLRLDAANLSAWQPDTQYDLVTCAHGLHYIGDKIGLLQRAVSWLKPEGLFLAHLDLTNIRVLPETSMKHSLGTRLRQAGFLYKRHQHTISFSGGRILNFGLRYLGADDQAGPNFSGQPAVNSFYATADAEGMEFRRDTV